MLSTLIFNSDSKTNKSTSTKPTITKCHNCKALRAECIVSHSSGGLKLGNHMRRLVTIPPGFVCHLLTCPHVWDGCYWASFPEHFMILEAMETLERPWQKPVTCSGPLNAKLTHGYGLVLSATWGAAVWRPTSADQATRQNQPSPGTPCCYNELKQWTQTDPPFLQLPLSDELVIGPWEITDPLEHKMHSS